MEDREYKVLKVSKEPPRQWNNPNGGVIYYIKTMLEGWDKPVSVGKKSPDALHEGDTIFGHIEVAAGMTEDKWKAGQNPNFGGGQRSFGGSGFGSSKPAYQPKDEAGIKAMWAIGQAVAALKPVDPKQVLDPTDVEALAKDFFSMVDRVKGSSEGTNPKAPVTSSTPLTTSKLDTDSLKEEDPEFASMLEAGLKADDIDLSEIPY